MGYAILMRDRVATPEDGVRPRIHLMCDWGRVRLVVLARAAGARGGAIRSQVS